MPAWPMPFYGRGAAGSRHPAPGARPTFLFAAGWTVFAYTQTLTWAGVPWAAQLALSQYQHLWFLSSASLFGSYFVTFILAAINACLAYAFLWARRSRKQAPGARRQAYLSTVLAASLLVGNTFLSCLCYAVPAAEGETVRVAVLQGNIASSEKWSSGKNALAIYGDLAREAAAEGATLIVWPETALADYLTGTKLTYVRTLAQETHTTQIVGAFDSVADEDGTLRRTNAFYLIDPTGAVQETRYYKRHLVPFGEYVPMEAVIRTLLPFLSDLEMLRDGSTLIAGTTPSLFQTAQGQIGGLICFDSIYPDLSRESAAAGAELLVLGTNDSWFFDSAAVYMHNGQAVLRAVENGRCVLRAANTGISSIISEKGEILAATEPLVEDYLVADVAYHAQPTLYTQIGDVFVLLCQMFLLVPPAAYLICRLRRRRTCPPQ